jgi:hypothetical protein
MPMTQHDTGNRHATAINKGVKRMKGVNEARNESDVLLKRILVKFGEKEYEIPVLRMKAAAIWRKEFFERSAELSASMIVDDALRPEELAKAVGNAATAMFLKFPDKIPELVFSYAPSLAEQREQIEKEAYDMDFAYAFAEIYKAAFSPFLASLGMVLEMQKAQASSSHSSAN